MLWAASYLCFFGFLCSGEVVKEVVAPAGGKFDPAYHLVFDDISVNNRETPSFMQVKLKASKTDPFRRGVTIYVGRTGEALCPVTACLGYMVARGSKPGSLFRWEDVRNLTRDASGSGEEGATGSRTGD